MLCWAQSTGKQARFASKEGKKFAKLTNVITTASKLEEGKGRSSATPVTNDTPGRPASSAACVCEDGGLRTKVRDHAANELDHDQAFHMLIIVAPV